MVISADYQEDYVWKTHLKKQNIYGAAEILLGVCLCGLTYVHMHDAFGGQVNFRCSSGPGTP